MTDVTHILNAIKQGDAKAADELLPLVYEELRCLAAQKLSHESPGQTLQATALVHEAYIRLVGDEQRSWENRGHFFAAAAEAMRRILVDNARRKKSFRHGGVCKRIDLNEAVLANEGDQLSEQLMALDEALTKLAEKDKVKADLVKLRYFAGLTGEQAAKVLGISNATAERYWDYARSWLRLEMTNRNGTIQA
jgi:RNA polymerase sigma factor (TIGR02999 family)